jgi:cation:H+ antiporter
MLSRFWKIALVLAFAAPALAVRLAGVPLPPLASIAVFGGGVVAASFLLAWAAEVAQVDVSASLATAVLALIAVLPEYAVDLYFAFSAGHDPSYGPYAAANMTGSNRLLIGIGWPLVALLLARSRRRRGLPPAPVRLNVPRRAELGYLGLASVYAFVLPAAGRIALTDAAVLLAIFAAYLWRVSREERSEPELHGLPATLAALPTRARRATVVGLFGFAALIIALAAKPFADSLVQGGRQLGLDEFLLVQWLAPLASEAPELLVAGILASRGDADAALGTLLSSKVNQWTLLVGSLPLAYRAGGGHGGLPLDGRQVEELLLTATQALLATAVLARLTLRTRDAVLLLAMFALQLAFPGREVRLGFAALYAVIAVAILIARRDELPRLGRALFATAPAGAPIDAPPAAPLDP